MNQTNSAGSGVAHPNAQPEATAGETRRRQSLLHHDEHEHTTPPTMRSQGRISRTLLNFWLDGLLGLLYVALTYTATIVQFVFPPGISARGATLLGMTFGQWCSIQFGLICVLGMGIVLHVMLHWTWVCSVLCRKVLKQQSIPDNGIRTLYGVGLLIALLMLGAVSLGIAQWMIVLPD